MALTATDEGMKVEGLACIRGEATLFRDLSFALVPGQGLFVRGPNGCGKSSLLRLLAGLTTPAVGTITFGGADIHADLQAYRRYISYLGHLDGLKAGETPREALTFRASLSELLGKGQMQSLVQTGMQTYADTPIRYLSAGQRRRVALAFVLSSNAALWLLDEPTTALDDASAAQIHAALQGHLAQGGMFIAATHDAVCAIDGATSLALGAA